jgi:hypothetical protein
VQQPIIHSKLHSTKKAGQLPKLILARVIKREIKQRYQVDYVPHVVRQRRVVGSGTLDILDYAVPCFELAAKLQTSANVLAKELASALQTGQQKPNAALIDYQIEAISGYVNFKLPADSFREATLAARIRFKKPYNLPSFDKGTDNYVILDIPGDTRDPDVTDMAIFYLHQAYAFAGKKQAVTYLLSDASEQMIPELHRALQTKPRESEHLHFERQARAALQEPVPYNQPLTEAVRRLQRDHKITWLVRRDQMPVRFHPRSHKYITQSALIHAAGRYIDQIAKSGYRKSIIKDASSGAVYLSDGNDSIPLRSAAGFLFSYAYTAYMLAYELNKAKANGGRVIVCAPHTLHRLLYKLAGLAASSRPGKHALVCFDPMVSRADILELQAANKSLYDHFSQIGRAVGSFKPQWLENKPSRYAVLSLIDAPIELMSQIATAQLPAVFDTLSQSVEMLAVLHDAA